MSKPRTAHWDMDIPIQIRVFGEPRPFPKKEAVASGDYRRTGRIIFAAKDYRTRIDPVTGKLEKYDRGYKHRWMDLVAATVYRSLVDLDLEPFPKNHPVAMGCLFFLTKALGNKLLYPSQSPDEDNLLYAVRNALKSTAKKDKPGRYPDGALYYDDNQIVWRVGPEGKLWATGKEPHGVLITVQDAFQLRHKIDEWQMVEQTGLNLRGEG